MPEFDPDSRKYYTLFGLLHVRYAVLAISVVTVVIGFSEIFVKQPTYLGVAAVIIGALAIYAHVFGVAWAYLPLAVQYAVHMVLAAMASAILLLVFIASHNAYFLKAIRKLIPEESMNTGPLQLICVLMAIGFATVAFVNYGMAHLIHRTYEWQKKHDNADYRSFFVSASSDE